MERREVDELFHDVCCVCIVSSCVAGRRSRGELAGV